MQELEAGQKFERYRVLHFLGCGISGESYEVEDTLLQRTVLLKLIHPWLLLSDAIRRQFFRDMQRISGITHPYLTAILDYGEVDGQLYMVRRFVGSGSLLNREGRRWFNPPLDPIDAITYTHQLALALHHLHCQGLAHGSLTFSNVMVSGSPTRNQEPDFAPFLLADAGTATFVRRFGLPKITILPITAAPEHLEKHIVPAGDQYALAVLLYFWLAGRPPFLGSPDMLMQQKVSETITPLTLFNPRVSTRQEEIILRALRSFPEKRFPTILAFAEALAESLQQPAHTILPDETPLQLFNISTYTTETPLSAEDEVEQTTTPAVEQNTEELLRLEAEPLERKTQSLTSDNKDEGDTSQDEEEAALPDLESLLASLLHVDQEPLPPASYYIPDDADNIDGMLTTEPALQNGQLTELGIQGHLTGIYDTETNVVWNNIVLQEQPEPKVAPDIPQPLPQPEITPEPQPEPKPQPAPQPEITPAEPNPQPTILPPPGPDIPQPLPEPGPTPPEKPALPERPTSPPVQPDEPQAHEVPKIMPRLVITSQYLAEPCEVALENELITLGRAGSSDILLDHDNLTSRHHAILKYDRDQYVIFDQRSAQGVLVNGQRLTVGVGWRLTDGDCVTIGAYTLVFHSSPPQDNAAPPEK